MTNQYLIDILDNQLNFSFTTNGKTIKQANKTLLDFFGFELLSQFTQKHDCICDFFLKEDGYLQKIQNDKTWLDILLDNPNKTHKVKVKDTYNTIFVFQLFTNGKLINNSACVISTKVMTISVLFINFPFVNN